MRGWSALTTWQQSAVTWLARRGYSPVIRPADGPELSATARNVRHLNWLITFAKGRCGGYVIGRSCLRVYAWVCQYNATDFASFFHCRIGHFSRFISISHTITGRFSRNSAKWLTPARERMYYILGAIRRTLRSESIRKSGFESQITLGWDNQSSRDHVPYNQSHKFIHRMRWRRYAFSHWSLVTIFIAIVVSVRPNVFASLLFLYSVLAFYVYRASGNPRKRRCHSTRSVSATYPKFQR